MWILEVLGVTAAAFLLLLLIGILILMSRVPEGWEDE